MYYDEKKLERLLISWLSNKVEFAQELDNIKSVDELYIFVERNLLSKVIVTDSALDMFVHDVFINMLGNIDWDWLYSELFFPNVVYIVEKKDLLEYNNWCSDNIIKFTKYDFEQWLFKQDYYNNFIDNNRKKYQNSK